MRVDCCGLKSIPELGAEGNFYRWIGCLVSNHVPIPLLTALTSIAFSGGGGGGG